MGEQKAEAGKVAGDAKRAYLELLGCSEQDKNEALKRVVESLEAHSEKIASANQKDLSSAEELVSQGEMTSSLRKRLVLDSKKLAGVIEGVKQVIRLPDPSNRVLWKMEMDQGLVLQRVTSPLGVVGVVFESRPDVVVQVSSLLLKAGNSGILKGGKEARQTNSALMEAIKDGLQAAGTVPELSIQLLSTREEVQGILNCDEEIDLLIPRGGKELVRHIQENTRIPVLGHTDGVCHVYVHGGADQDKALRVVVDSKTDYPAVCNAAETIVVDKKVGESLIKAIISRLKAKNVEVKGCGETCRIAPDIGEAGPEDWSREYLDLIVNIRLVEDLKEAVTHINRYGSHHTDAIVTEDGEAASYFLKYVDSAGVFVNASTRFADGFRYGLGAEIGISTNKIHARGPVGLEGIVTYKYQLQGNGHAAADYGPGKRSYTHRLLKG